MRRIRDLFRKKIRITEISTPLGGVGWEYTDSQREAAEKLLTFLENRRVLISDIAERCPTGVIESVRQIREKVQAVREAAPRDSVLFEIATQIRLTAVAFIGYACQGCADPTTCKDCTIYETGCMAGLYVFREQMWSHIDDLCSRFHLEMSPEFKNMLEWARQSGYRGGCPLDIVEAATAQAKLGAPIKAETPGDPWSVVLTVLSPGNPKRQESPRHRSSPRKNE